MVVGLLGLGVLDPILEMMMVGGANAALLGAWAWAGVFLERGRRADFFARRVQDGCSLVPPPLDPPGWHIPMPLPPHCVVMLLNTAVCRRCVHEGCNSSAAHVVCLLCAVVVLAAVGAGSDGVPAGRRRR
jgi:hypothetical protein